MDLATLVEGMRSLWLVWLILLFAAIMFWAFRPKNKRRFEDDARIPFKDDQGGD